MKEKEEKKEEKMHAETHETEKDTVATESKQEEMHLKNI